MLRNSLVIGVLVVLLSLAGVVAADSKPVNHDGWWIRFESDKTACDSIDLDVGIVKDTSKKWMTWKKGDAAEVELPADYRQASAIYVRAVAHPDGRSAAFLLMYKDHIAQAFNFHGDEDHSVKQTDTDHE